jgi:hypothetical protein
MRRAGQRQLSQIANGGTDPLRFSKAPKRNGHLVEVDTMFRGLLMPVEKSGLGVQRFDLLEFSGG